MRTPSKAIESEGSCENQSWSVKGLVKKSRGLKNLPGNISCVAEPKWEVHQLIRFFMLNLNLSNKLEFQIAFYDTQRKSKFYLEWRKLKSLSQLESDGNMRVAVYRSKKANQRTQKTQKTQNAKKSRKAKSVPTSINTPNPQLDIFKLWPYWNFLYCYNPFLQGNFVCNQACKADGLENCENVNQLYFS